MMQHNICYTDVYRSVWNTVYVVNIFPKLQFTFPISHDKQKEIVGYLATKSSTCFDTCDECIDGVLIWTRMPTETVPDEAKLGGKKVFCGRKMFQFEYAGHM